MTFKKISGITYTVEHTEEDLEKVENIYGMMYPTSGSEMNNFNRYFTKRNIFANMIVDTFINEVGVDDKAHIKSPTVYEMKLFLMHTTAKGMEGISYSVE